jgi:hypothetical protein
MNKYPTEMTDDVRKKNENVSNETLQEDLLNTIKEMNAYDLLERGFYQLTLLPENFENGESSRCQLESMKYDSLKKQCQEFANFLTMLANDRNLIIES